MTDKKKWYEAEIDFGKLTLAGITKPPFEHEKAHTYPVSQPDGPEWETHDANWLFEELPDCQSFRFYIHVPFCGYKCNFCFYKTQTGCDEGTIDRYLDTLEKEIRESVRRVLKLKELPDVLVTEQEDRRIPLRDLYIGGGTPTTLNAEQLGRLLKIIWEVAKPEKKETFVATCECTPDSLVGKNDEGFALGQKKIKALLEGGISRFSLGIQSSTQELSEIGRNHSFEQATKAVGLIQQESKNTVSINVDLIYGFPNQTLENWGEDLDNFWSHLGDKPPHSITFYYMRYHPDSLLSKNTQDWERVPWSTLVDMRRLYCEKADGWGYQMCRPHFWRKTDDPETMKYQGAPCLDHDNVGAQLGFGPSSYSHINDRIGRNAGGIGEWKTEVTKQQLGRISGREISEEDRWTRYVIRKLYRNPTRHISSKRFFDEFGVKLSTAFNSQILRFEWLQKNKVPVIEIDKDGWKLTDAGLLVDEEIVYSLYPNPYRTKKSYHREFGTATLDLNNQVALLLREFVKNLKLIEDKDSNDSLEFITPGSRKEKRVIHQALYCSLKVLRDRHWLDSEDESCPIDNETTEVSTDSYLNIGPLLPPLSFVDGMLNGLEFDIVGVPYFGSLSVHKVNVPEVVEYKTIVSNQRDVFCEGNLFRVPVSENSQEVSDNDKHFTEVHKNMRIWITRLINEKGIVKWDSSTETFALSQEFDDTHHNPETLLWRALKKGTNDKRISLDKLFSHEPNLKKHEIVIQYDPQSFFQFFVSPILKTRQNSALAEIGSDVPLILVRRWSPEPATVKFAYESERDDLTGASKTSNSCGSCEDVQIKQEEPQRKKATRDNVATVGTDSLDKDQSEIKNILILSGTGWEEVLLTYISNGSKCKKRNGQNVESCLICEETGCPVFGESISLEPARSMLRHLKEYVKLYASEKGVKYAEQWSLLDAVEFVTPLIYLGTSVVTCFHCKPMGSRRGSLSLSLACNPFPPVFTSLRPKGLDIIKDDQLFPWISTVSIAVDKLVRGVMRVQSGYDIQKEGKEEGVRRIEDKLGHEVIKAYEPVLPLLHRLRVGEFEKEKVQLFADLARVAILYGIIQTSTTMANSAIEEKQLNPNLLAWKLFLLRDVFKESLSAKIDDNFHSILKLWESRIFEKVVLTSELNDIVAEGSFAKPRVKLKIRQLYIIILVNAIKHHLIAVCGLRKGAGLVANVGALAKMEDVCTCGNMVKVCFKKDDCGRKLTLCVDNVCGIDEVGDNWVWEKGTPLAIEMTCRDICLSLNLDYQQETCITKWVDNRRFYVKCEFDLN